jgi:hypothetical protein
MMRACGRCGLIGFTRIDPLVLCGLTCGFVGVSGADWPGGLVAWPAPLATLLAIFFLFVFFW